MRKSKKELKRDAELELQEKREQFTEEHRKLVQDAKDLAWPLSFVPNLEEYVSRKLDEVEQRRVRIPTGKYQDPQKLQAEYQQKFFLYIQELCPEVIDELRELLPNFIHVFGEDSGKYNEIFHSHKMELFDLDYSLENSINHLLAGLRGIRFNEDKSNTYRYDYPWGEYSLVLNIMFLLLVGDATETQRERSIAGIVAMLGDRLAIDWDVVGVEENAREQFQKDFAFRVLEWLLASGECVELGREGTAKITKFLEGITPADPQMVISFLRLIIPILEWAQKNRIEKTWVLRYALYFLQSFQASPAMQISDLKILSLDVRSLAAFPFEFRFPGWLAGDERREDYEHKLVGRFKIELTHYFDYAHSYLELDKVKRVTATVKYERVKWLVRRRVQGWSRAQIIREIDSDSEEKNGRESYIDESSLDKAFQQFRQYDLPV